MATSRKQSKLCHHKRKATAIDLFAGAGGLSLGFARAGFSILQAIDADARALATYEMNNPTVDTIQKDISRVSARACLKRAGLLPREVTVLIGGPPCQGFSESNRRTRTVANKRNHLYQHFFRFVRSVRPRWFVMENVAGIKTLASGKILRAILRTAKSVGYTAECWELNSADYGVPQIRRRVFLVGVRADLNVKVPAVPLPCARKKRVAVRQAIDDLPILRVGNSKDTMKYRTHSGLSAYQRLMRAGQNGVCHGNLVTRSSSTIVDRYKHIRPGQNWEAIPQSLLNNYADVTRCHTGIYYRLKWGKPSKVIGNFRKNMLIHPSQNRGLSIREAARLQSFPDKYRFVGSIGFQQQQVADAVPPLLAQAVASAILGADEKSRARPRQSA